MANMDYRYSEHHTLSVVIRLNLHEVKLLHTLARNLMADTEEAIAARSVTGMERWDARSLRDAAQTVLQSVAESMKFEAEEIAAKASA
jgi:hypothetical protein